MKKSNGNPRHKKLRIFFSEHKNPKTVRKNDLSNDLYNAKVEIIYCNSSSFPQRY